MRPTANWVVGSQALTSAGQIVGGSTPASVPTWNPGSGNTIYNLVSGTPITFQAVVVQSGVSGQNPTIGRVVIDELKGKILFSIPSTTSSFDVAVGVYVSEFTINTSAWDVSDPINPSDAARDQWFFLDAKSIQMPVYTASTPYAAAEMDISFRSPIFLGGGQALNVTVSMIAEVNTQTLFCNPAFRTRIRTVA
jgi:hypothetical protein